MTMMTRVRALVLMAVMAIGMAAARAEAQTAADTSAWQSFTAGNVFVTSGTRTYLLLQNKLPVEQEFEWFYVAHGTSVRVLRSQTLAPGASASVDLNGDPYLGDGGTHAFALQVDSEGAADVTLTVHPAIPPTLPAFWLRAIYIPVRQGPYLP